MYGPASNMVFAAYEGRFNIILVPNITNAFYGRDVGYKIERIDFDQPLQEISATRQRGKMGAV